MSIRSMVKMLSTAGSIMLVICGVLATSAFAQCSNETFAGDYGFSVNGVILTCSAPPCSSQPLTIQGVQLIHADGKGNLVDHETLSIDGTLKQGVLDPNFPGSTGEHFGVNTGTYTITPFCTGTVHIQDANGASVFLDIVLDKQGNQVRMTVTLPFKAITGVDPGTPRVVSSVGERVAPLSD